MTTVDATLVNAPDEIARAQQLLDEFSADNALSEEVMFALNVALDEILSNIVNYAYPDNARGEIKLRLSVADAMAVIELDDDGEPFDPLALPEPDVNASLAARKVGGLGVHLVRRLMDSVEYERVTSHNRLVLKKSLADRGETESGNSGS